jgi:hypothetical protein
MERDRTMDDYEKLVVDFVFPMEFEAAIEDSDPTGVRLARCPCGANNYVLASDMAANPATGLPASRMYECTACGEYRLG